MARALPRGADMIRRYVVLGVVWAGCTVAPLGVRTRAQAVAMLVR